VANYALGTRPANDVAFADHRYETIDDFYAELEEVGLIGGSGTEITYPGPGEIDDTGVTETEPGGPDASCAADATPVAGDDATPESGDDDSGADDEDEATPESGGDDESDEESEDDATPTS